MALPTTDHGTALERDRLLGVYRNWRRASGERAHRWWRRTAFDEISEGMLAFSCLLCLPVDSGLWSFRWLFPLPHRIYFPGAILSALLLVTFLANALLIDHGLSRMTPDEGSWPRWLRAARFLIGGVPLLGLYVVPGWRWLRERRPDLARGRDGKERGRATPSARPGTSWLDPTRRVPSLSRPQLGFFWVFLWLSVGNLAVLLVSGCWLAGALGGERRALFEIAFLLHTPFFYLAIRHLGSRAKRLHLPRSKRVLLFAVAAFWLVPIPFAVVAGMLCSIGLGVGRPRSEEIVYHALLRREDAARLPAWLRLEDILRHSWGGLAWRQRLWSPPSQVEGPSALGRTESRIHVLYDLRTFAVAFDAAALTWAMSWLAVRRPRWGGVLQAAHTTLLAAALLLLLVTLATEALHLLAVTLRLPGRLRVLDRHPYATAVAKVQAAALAGLWLGADIALGKRREVGLLLTSGSALLLTLKGLAFALRPALAHRKASLRRLSDELPALILLFALEILGGINVRMEVLAPAIAAWVLATPLCALFVGHTLLPWLLRPFDWRQLFARRLPPRIRLALAVLMFTALAPLGGLALPVCIAIRHRLWPGAQQLALDAAAQGARCGRTLW